MIDQPPLLARRVELARQIDRLRRHRPAEIETLKADRDAFDLVCFNLMVAASECIAIAAHRIAAEGWRPAQDPEDAFHRLHEQRVISRETTETPVQLAGLRQLILRGCARENPGRIFRATTAGLDDLERFSREVVPWTEKRSSPRGH